VQSALLWGFHNSRFSVCFPSYERIAEQAECGRATVYEAPKVLEWAGVLTWQNRHSPDPGVVQRPVRARRLAGCLGPTCRGDRSRKWHRGGRRIG
jgi:hypothetical protein